MIKLNRRWLLFIILFLVVVIAASSISVFKEQPSQPNPPSIFWRMDLENFVSDIVVDDGRVFVVDGVDLICLNKTNGEVVWSKNIGGTTSTSKLVLYEGKVYAGTYGGVVTSFDKNTGEELLRFQAPVSTTWGSKSSPEDFFIEDGRLFVWQNGYAVFDATSGELFYERESVSRGGTINLGNAAATASESSFIFMMGETRLNPNNGEIVWDLPGRASDPAVINQDKVILWNYNPDASQELGPFILCVDASSGAILWDYDVCSPMYQPTVYNELVMFGAYDGNFYALYLSNGHLAWKTLVTNQNNQTKIVGSEGRDLTPVVSPIQIESKKGIGVWSFAFIQNGWGGVIEYVGTICGVDVANGQRLWTTPIKNNASISSSNLLRPTSLGLSLLKDNAFLTVGSDFYIINMQTGSILEEKNYDHHLLEPTATKDIVFVAEELRLIAYRQDTNSGSKPLGKNVGKR